ncbi:50S ribosomal protein L24 [bacterium]|nr:50S ribosomal protein L24 [bacterium]MBU0899840.1 50S ribosomal protein L24 [bacterium]MBU1153620.1 50S ribosomal protein L24 [bacterium]MBU2600257.1 50S ribosomal protein L24 [bacterium]
MLGFSLNVKKNDQVAVITGKDKGKQGKVLRILRAKGKVIIEGVNQKKKHSRPTGKNPQGGIIEIDAPIHISNVMVICPNCSKLTRIGKKFLGNGKKVRICKKCQEVIEK